MSSQSAPDSRLPFTNRADPQDGHERASTVRMAEQPESGRGHKLREEVTWDSLGGVEAVTWTEATKRFRSWYSDQRDTKIVVESEVGETKAFRTPNRFTPEYREMLYAKAQALERGLRERWGKLLHTAMLTLSASSTDAEGNPRPPVEHLEDLLSSWEAVRRALSRSLEGRDWEYLAIIEPHESGYAHIHLGVFVKGPIVREQFQPVIDAHLRNSDGAGPEAHEIVPDDGDSAVTVRQSSHPSRENGVENLGAYLAAYMAGEYGAEATEMPAHVQRFYATMWATGRQWFRPSNGAQELMQPPEDEAGPLDWEVVGIAPDGDPESEVIDVEATGGGVQYRRLERDGEMPEAHVPEPEPDPPPESWGGLRSDRRHQ